MKTCYWIAVGIVAVAILVTSLIAQEKKARIEVRKVKPEDSAILKEWERVTNEQDVLGVSAARTKHPKWTWHVSIAAAEFARKDPISSRLQRAITAALKKSKGVKNVAHEDTEVWLVEGEASGEELVRNCSAAIDELADDLRKHLNALK